MVDTTDSVTESQEAPEQQTTDALTPTDPSSTGVAAFEKILGAHGGLTEDEGTQEEAAPEAEESAPESAPEAEQATKEEQPAVSPKLRDRALQALKRAKAPQHVLDQLEDPSTIEWGLELAEQHAEVDRRMSTEGKRVSGEAEAGDGAESATAETPAPAPVVVPEVEFDFEAAVKPLEDHLDPEGATALVTLVKDYGSQVQQQVTARYEAELAPMRQMMEGMIVDQSLREVQERFPGLADKEQKEAVRGKMHMLARTGEYQSGTDLAEDACKLVFHHQSDSAASSRTLELDRKRDGGSPTVPRGETRSKKLTPAERARAAFRESLAKHS